jgi:hypothetical protein
MLVENVELLSGYADHKVDKVLGEILKEIESIPKMYSENTHNTKSFRCIEVERVERLIRSHMSNKSKGEQNGK